MIDIVKKIYHLFRPVKCYTIEEYSQEIVRDLRERGATIGTN